MNETKPGERPDVTDRTGRTAQVFLRNCDSGEPAYYCGPVDDREKMREAMGHVLAAELDGTLMNDEQDVELRLEIWWMTAAEIAAIPAI